MEYEKCYVFHPEDARPVKRRRTEPQGLQASWHTRQSIYHKVWNSQRKQIDERLESINRTVINEILAFLEDNVGPPQPQRIPTCFVQAAPSSALSTSIAAQVQAADEHISTRRVFVSLSSEVSSNLKTSLKAIIQKATSMAPGDDEEDLELASASKKGPKLLNYDLQLLHDFTTEHKVQQILIAFEDTEAFDSSVLSELIELLACWTSRIPFALLFTIATNIDFLQQRLSRAAARCLNGKLFNAALSGDEIEQVFEATITPETSLWLGPGLAAMAIERQTDYIQSIDSMVDAIQYAYMSCFYANALSIFLDTEMSSKNIPQDHFEALRNLGSFRSFASRLLQDGETQRLKTLLDSDVELMKMATQSINEGKQTLAEAMAALEAIRSIQAAIPGTHVLPKSAFYIQALSGKLAASPTLRSLLLSFRKAPSDVAQNVMREFCACEAAPKPIKAESLEILDELNRLVQAQGDAAQPLRSEDDLKNSTFRTTVVAKKVELSKQKSTLSKQDEAYTAILRRFSDVLEAYFAEKLIDPKQLLMHEIFIYDLKSPHREVFTPRPRHAIERALAAPHDYLDCDCCTPGQDDAAEATLAASQPATAVLYQLYLESGSLINVSDLWQAFLAIVGDTQNEEQRTMALFQRGLAELRHLGLVKGTRKRIDHVAKVAWRGL